MKNQMVLVEKEIAKIENALVNKAAMVQNMDQLLSFYFTYLSHYMPILEYAIENMPENSIAKLANFGILIDQLSSIKINNVVDLATDLQVREISEKTKKPKSEIAKIFSDISISNKIQVASAVILSSSISRDFSLSTANTKFNALNKITIWSNLFNQLTKYPALIDTFINEELLNEATTDLKFSKDRIQDKSRAYDYDLASDWQHATDFTKKQLLEVPKLFVGAKIAWLQAMKGLELAKCIYYKKKKHGEQALLYNNRLIRLLSNQNVSNNEWSYRNFNSFGPCVNIKKILDHFVNKEKTNVSIVSSNNLFIQTPSIRFFINVSGIYSLYINSSMFVNYEKGVSIPVKNDIGAVLTFHNSPAKFVIDNIRNLSNPEDSSFYSQLLKDKKIIEEIIKDVNSIITKLSITYGNNLNKNVAETVKTVTKNGLEGIVIYGSLFTLEKLAQSVGIDITAELWSQTRLTISGILLGSVQQVSKKAKEISDEEDKQSREKAKSEKYELTNEERLEKIYKKIDESKDAFNEAYQELGESGLSLLLQSTQKIKNILLSGLSIEEINKELSNYFDSIKE